MWFVCRHHFTFYRLDRTADRRHHRFGFGDPASGLPGFRADERSRRHVDRKRYRVEGFMSIALIILTGLIATQGARLLPVLLGHRMELPPQIKDWLRFVPASILAAVIIPEFYQIDANAPEFTISFRTTYWIAGILTLVVGLQFKNLLWATATGVVCMSLLRAFGNF
jgi:branched-subunit amino acid transport protein